ncbi:oxidoreductase [Pseudobacteriovorax antillogorgiicola]|uniref:Uncharacterized conserved protein YbjT, contains NAD(P)-binding and DUF2867 domains n=1 Tax=Pseudobacteriovorax antillogorgiicola TaxID=1513793 RepID=A0A1Y6BJE0_9BACT|nr:oxidoreductase [Pseudobacteriovorax antillogorgiicola]TCS56344.1 uncharacterized protein YbjT (DUF2867 family) [Pseudobacteriovorax antillogorgiicola]SMF06818.1 Uncharacterized conserved protein YbjT, contains NAD(P)-binding and DUF2867 domains [Pseudobacteriovorax antillogorgiicola]
MAHAVIIGATGLVGNCLTHLCNESPFFDRVTAFSRRPITGISSEGFNNVIIEDFESLESSHVPDLSEDTFGFCCLGTTQKKAGSKEKFEMVDYQYVLRFSKICKSISAKHLSIVSSLGASTHSLSYYCRVKGRMEREVEKLDLNSTSIVRPSLLLGDREESRPAEDIGKLLAPLIIGPWKPIEGFSVAKAMLSIAIEAKPGFHVYPSRDLHLIADGT